MTTLMKNSSIELTVRSSSQYLSVLLLTDSAGGGRGFLATFTKFYKGTPLIGMLIYDHFRYIIFTNFLLLS